MDAHETKVVVRHLVVVGSWALPLLGTAFPLRGLSCLGRSEDTVSGRGQRLMTSPYLWQGPPGCRLNPESPW